MQPKNPTLAAFLSFFICGLGQAYVGNWPRAAFWFFGAMAVSFLTFWTFGLGLLAFWIVGIIDANKQATLYNENLKKKDVPQTA